MRRGRPNGAVRAQLAGPRAYSRPGFGLAQRAGEDVPRPVVVGPVTYLLLSKASDAAGEGFAVTDRLPDLLAAYGHLLADLWAAGAEWVQLDEPALVCDAWDVPREEVLAAAADEPRRVRAG